MTVKSSQTITVMLSHYDTNAVSRAFDRLDVKIMENFGKVVNLKIEYINANVTLNEVFHSKDRFKQFRRASAEYT